ncbi:hypothetical protein [Marivita hallyeonensis]|uniref:Uncharacterized protein n=1 Tax=Marivita hallyeonensis TaxID=996342 RepID=A0A1M5WYA7_9RHOB|nr:hypothetical protein [Marivita hallyeonensis]SHH92501.1 hypothetical protein SAMN05443551_3595 [Marivita hallyeonensis]
MWVLRALSIAFFVVGIGLLVAVWDYWTQMERAEGEFDTRVYVTTVMDRFGDMGGAMTVALSRSQLVLIALPDAPEGWTAEAYIDTDDNELFSTSQWNASDEILDAAIGHMEPELQRLSQTDHAIFNAYLRNTTRTYRLGDSRIDLYVTDPDKPVAHPVWQRYDQAITNHFDSISDTMPFGMMQGIEWVEHVSALERASNGPLPHELRAFVGYIGDVRLDLITRASDDALNAFLNTTDWSELRDLSAASAPKQVAVVQQSGDVSSSVTPRARSED